MHTRFRSLIRSLFHARWRLLPRAARVLFRTEGLTPSAGTYGASRAFALLLGWELFVQSYPISWAAHTP